MTKQTETKLETLDDKATAEVSGGYAVFQWSGPGYSFSYDTGGPRPYYGGYYGYGPYGYARPYGYGRGWRRYRGW
jgi:hypothetical protein